MDEVDQVGPEVRGEEDDLAGVSDQAVAEHQAVLLIGQFAWQGARTRDDLERRLEQARHGVADAAGDAAERSHAEGDVANDLHRCTACLVDHADGDFGHDEDGVDQHDRRQPHPSLQFLRGESIGYQCGHEPADHHHGNGGQVVA